MRETGLDHAMCCFFEAFASQFKGSLMFGLDKGT